MNNERFLSISDINKYISFKFEQDVNLQEVYLQGEISNFKYSGKHCYFSLKDSSAEISAMYFYPYNLELKFKPLDGMSVQVVGKIQVYQKKGTYAIIIKKMAQTGVGLLYQEFLDLKEKLEKEGLFDENKKLPLPEYPEKIAVVTASTGEAIHDIISTFNRRFPLAKIKLYPALVQGIDAPKDLMRALKQVYLDGDADAIIIGRGGGSFEDLSCFNDEALARMVFASPIPIVSAVGHEGDYTICDFVASHRAPTPTGAAVLLSKDQKDIINLLVSSSKRLKGAITAKLKEAFQNWFNLHNSYGLANFSQIIENKVLIYQQLEEKLNRFNPVTRVNDINNALNEANLRLENAMTKVYDNSVASYHNFASRLRIDLVNNKIEHLEKDVNKFYQDLNTNFRLVLNHFDNSFTTLKNKIVLLNPFNIMEKGYSIVYKNDKIITSTKQLLKNDIVTIEMVDGKVDAIIK